MVFRVGQSPVGYDHIGTFDQDLHLEIQSAEIIIGEPSAPPTVPPHKPADHPQVCTISIGPDARSDR